MNLQELSKRAHENAVNHGFWGEKHSNEHCLMLVITEISEMVEADRKGRNADLALYRKMLPSAYYRPNNNDDKHKPFVDYIKNTLEDELADVAIRLLDLSGALGIEFDKMQPCRYFRAFDRFSFTENAFALCKGLSKDKIAVEKRIQFGLEYVENWATHLNVDLSYFIDLKMNYNESRQLMHGKKY